MNLVVTQFIQFHADKVMQLRTYAWGFSKFKYTFNNIKRILILNIGNLTDADWLQHVYVTQKEAVSRFMIPYKDNFLWLLFWEDNFNWPEKKVHQNVAESHIKSFINWLFLKFLWFWRILLVITTTARNS